MDSWEAKYWRLCAVADELDFRLNRVRALVNDVSDDMVPVVAKEDLSKVLDDPY